MVFLWDLATVDTVIGLAQSCREISSVPLTSASNQFGIAAA